MPQAKSAFEAATGIPLSPVKREVSRTFLDINGIIHQSYGAAYRASVRSKLISIIADGRNQYLEATSDEIADAIMKEMVVAWG